MRRYLILLFLLLAITLLAIAVGAQDDGISTPDDETSPIVVQPPEQMLASRGVWQPVAVEPVEPEQLPLSVTAAGATDECTAAPDLSPPDGGQTTVNSMTTASGDPTLSCMWGTPSSSQGYRTVWYKFTAPHNGQVVIDTFGSNYDTVLAVYSGSCGSLTQLACNDDTQGFSSRIALTVSKDATYYVEAADWQSGVAGTATLNISVWMESIDSRWEQAGTMPLARSRHATAVVGNDIYVIGGQTVLAGTPELTSRLDRFETDTGNWVQLADMPDVGYSNTTAAYSNGRIYLPAGYNGNDATFDGTHWAYDIASNSWSTRTSAPWPTAPIAWSAAVVDPNLDGYYLVGGLSSQPPFTSTAQVHDEIFLYSAVTDSWVARDPIETDLGDPDPRYAHTAAWVDNRLCVAGGIGSGNVLQINGTCYDFVQLRWEATADMNYPRYNAGSAVGPDGKWYVFGGVDGAGNAVSVTEVYDPATNSWTALDVAHDLGGSAATPGRGWPRGGRVGSEIWAIGGNEEPGKAVISLVEKLFIPSFYTLFPYVANVGPDQADDNFGLARQLTLNQPQNHNFSDLNDYFDVFYFDLLGTTAVTARLTQIPAGSDYNIAIYSTNKLLWGTGDNPGNQDESVSLTLAAGRYYVVVERVYPFGAPNTANYQIVIEN